MSDTMMQRVQLRFRQENALRSIRQKAERLSNSLALVCGSDVLPNGLRGPLEAVANDVRQMFETADRALGSGQ